MTAEYFRNINVDNLNNTGTISVKLTPNPSTGLVTIEVDEGIPSCVNVYDIRGNRCYSDKYPGSNRFSLDLSSFNTGTYFVELLFDHGVIVKKLLLYY